MIAGPKRLRPGDYERLNTAGHRKRQAKTRVGETSSSNRYLNVPASTSIAITDSGPGGMVRAVNNQQVRSTVGGGDRQGCGGTRVGWEMERLVDMRLDDVCPRVLGLPGAVNGHLRLLSRG